MSDLNEGGRNMKQKHQKITNIYGHMCSSLD